VKDKQIRHKPAVRKALILEAAVEVASLPGGWSAFTRDAIAKQAACSDGLVSRYLGDIPEARKLVMRQAIKREILSIIVQSLAAQDGYAKKGWLPASLKLKAIESLR